MNEENVIADFILLRENNSFLIKEGFVNFLEENTKKNIKKIVNNLFNILTEEQLKQLENSSILKIIYQDTYIKTDSSIFKEKFCLTSKQSGKIKILKNKLYKILIQIRKKIEKIIQKENI